MSHLDPELLSGALDEDLTLDERRSVEEHLATCAGCRDALTDLRDTHSLVRSVPRPEISELHRKQLHRSINKARRAPANMWRAMVAVAGTAAAIAAFVGITMLGTGGDPSVLADRVTIASTTGDFTSADLELWSAQEEMLPPSTEASALASPPMDSNTPSMSATAPPSPVPPSGRDLGPPANHGAQIARCESIFKPGGNEGARALRYVIGSFEGVPAYLLAYEVPRDDPVSVEVFAIAQQDCRVLYRASR